MTGDLDTFGEIVETEALTLHALMMCSTPSFTLMTPNTLAMIEAIRDFRESSQIPVYFTLDAGPIFTCCIPTNSKVKCTSLLNSN